MNSLLTAVLFGFAVSLAAPWIAARTGKRAGVVLSLAPLALFLYFVGLAAPVARGELVSVQYAWAPALGIHFSLRADGLGLLFALLITGIGFLIFVYSAGYLGGHRRQGRFHAYLMLFMASMLGLVLADDMALLYVFWELTSVSSFLLIGFEHEKKEARQAAWQALLVTALGGLALLAAAILMNAAGGSFAMSELASRGDALRADSRYEAILLLVLLGAFTKSAQFPFHFWLPNAMAAPTPVSAYLHSATMVKAGVYLLARLSPALGGTEAWMLLVTGFGVVTMLVGGGLALVSTDFKRMLAYLTVSALGMMTMLLGIGSAEAVKACLVFLLAHAFYKAALFMNAGAVDHATGTRQLGELGGLARAMPMTATAACLAAVSLAGFGPVLSFVGKEMMLKSVLHLPFGGSLLAAAIVAAAATFVAAAGLVSLQPFFGKRKTEAKCETSPLLWAGALFLAVLGVVFALWPKPIETALVAPSVASVLGRTESVDLALWHGLKTPFLLSAVSAAIGVVVYILWQKFHDRVTRAGRMLRWGPERWYELALSAMNRIAVVQTKILQNGYLGIYILTIILTTVALTSYALFSRGEFRWTTHFEELRYWEVVVAAVILVSAVAAAVLRPRFAVIASLSVAGYGVAIIFILFGAPDLAMTQFVVETLVLVLLVIAFFRLPAFKTFSGRATRLRDLAVSVSMGALLTVFVLGASGERLAHDVTRFYMEKSLPEAKGHNVVNVVLVDFRALDTLGEITVLVTAAVGVFALLKLRNNRKVDR
jgi:multicomponent Na+:H+ antiporter subunit A